LDLSWGREHSLAWWQGDWFDLWAQNKPAHELNLILPGRLGRAFVAAGAPIIVGLDDPIERRRAAKIAAKETPRGALPDKQDRKAGIVVDRHSYVV
jgi:hypothetical protein